MSLDRFVRIGRSDSCGGKVRFNTRRMMDRTFPPCWRKRSIHASPTSTQTDAALVAVAGLRVIRGAA